MKFSQEDVNRSFEAYTESSYHSKGDVARIQSVLKSEFGIDLTLAQTIDFWRWRSDEWFSGWLVIASDREIIKWFEVWMDWASRGFTGFPIKPDQISDPELNMFL